MVETLATKGYMHRNADGTHTYYAPDAEVLLSDQFIQTHCFSVVRETEKHEGHVGLSFVPIESGRLVDVEGALWLDETSGELRTVEYRYAGLPASVSDPRNGGQLEFMPLLSGA